MLNMVRVYVGARRTPDVMLSAALSKAKGGVEARGLSGSWAPG
jgi:hypothetical protein